MTLSGWCSAGAHVSKRLQYQHPCPQGPENGGNCTCACHPTLKSRFTPKNRPVEDTKPL